MAERRSNYTGAEHGDLIKRTIEASEGERPVMMATPMMIVNEIGRMASRLVEEGAPTQFMQNSSRLILRVLSCRGGLCQLDLARATHLKPPTISVALSKMEEEGLVTRVIDGTDGRATRVYLTDKGIAINEQLKERIRTVDAAAIEGLTDEECEALRSILEKMRSNLGAVADKK